MSNWSDAELYTKIERLEKRLNDQSNEIEVLKKENLELKKKLEESNGIDGKKIEELMEKIELDVSSANWNAEGMSQKVACIEERQDDMNQRERSDNSRLAKTYFNMTNARHLNFNNEKKMELWLKALDLERRGLNDSKFVYQILLSMGPKAPDQSQYKDLSQFYEAQLDFIEQITELDPSCAESHYQLAKLYYDHYPWDGSKNLDPLEKYRIALKYVEKVHQFDAGHKGSWALWNQCQNKL